MNWTKSTKDPAIARVRKLTEAVYDGMTQCAADMMDYRETISTQATRIEELKAKLERAQSVGHDAIHRAIEMELAQSPPDYATTARIEELVRQNEELKVDIGLLQRSNDEHARLALIDGWKQAEVDELRDELEKQKEQSNFSITLVDKEDLVGQAQSMFDAAVVHPDPYSRAHNVTKLVTAAIEHLNKGLAMARAYSCWEPMGHKIEAAIDLLTPLARGLHDVYKHDADAKAGRKARPDDGTQDTEDVGQAHKYHEHHADCVPNTLDDAQSHEAGLQSTVDNYKDRLKKFDKDREQGAK